LANQPKFVYGVKLLKRSQENNVMLAVREINPIYAFWPSQSKQVSIRMFRNDFEIDYE